MTFSDVPLKAVRLVANAIDAFRAVPGCVHARISFFVLMGSSMHNSHVFTFICTNQSASTP